MSKPIYVPHVEPFVRPSASEENRARDYLASLGISDVDGLLRTFYPNMATLLRNPAVAQTDRQGLTGGQIRLRCQNGDTHTIPPFSVVEIFDKSNGGVPTNSQWPYDPSVWIRRPKQGALLMRAGFVDEEVASGESSTVIIAGFAIIWLNTTYPNLRYPSWSGARRTDDIWDPVNGDISFADTQADSFRLWTAPAGEFTVLSQYYYGTEPTFGYHPEADSSNYYEKWLGVVIRLPWWG